MNRSQYTNRVVVLFLGCAFVATTVLITETLSLLIYKKFGPLHIRTDFHNLRSPSAPIASAAITPPPPSQPEPNWEKLAANTPDTDCTESTSSSILNGESDKDSYYMRNALEFSQFSHFKPNLNIPSSKFYVNHKAIYDIQISTDSFGRRTTFRSQSSPAQSYLSLLGGSFIFGDGANDNETISSYMSPFFKTSRVYNYGISGHGIATQYKQLQVRDFKQELPEDSGIFLYFFFDFDVLRLIPTFREFNSNPLSHELYLEENQDGLAFIPEGRLDRIFLTSIFSLLNHSATLRLFNFDFPTVKNEHLQLFAKILTKMRETAENRANSRNFVVVAYPEYSGALFPALRPYLDAAKITSIDLSAWQMNKLMATRPWYPCDEHAYPATNKLIASELSKIIIENNIFN